MSTIDETLRRLTEEWRAVARYRVFISTWFPEKTKTVLASGLSYERAVQRAAGEYELLRQRDPEVRGRFADPSVEIELDNREELDARRRARNTAKATASDHGSVQPARGPTDGGIVV
jgi:hypothetical protein